MYVYILCVDVPLNYICGFYLLICEYVDVCVNSMC